MREVTPPAADWQPHDLQTAAFRRRQRDADTLAKAVADQLQEAFPHLDPRVIAYPERGRLQIVWDEADGTIRTHWVSWEGMRDALPTYAAVLTRFAIGAIQRQRH